MLTLHMPASSPGNTGHRPDSSSASGAVGKRYSGKLENGPQPGV
ncbi:hypothetical protein [Methanospirillum lacunae]|nr:hypothetical protein [Methanospirillum lacunae]